MLRSLTVPFILCLFMAAGCSKPYERIYSYQESPEDKLSKVLAKRPKIVIDAGHGGKDLGAESKTAPTSQEKHLNLTTALMLNSFLKKMGYQTILTRGDDLFVPLELRAAIANGNEAALFVSVHYNSATSPKAEGVEVYYFESDENKGRSQKSKELAAKVLDRVIESTGSKSRGVKHGNFAVIRETKMPAVLVEGGFVSNQNELLKLRSPDYQKTLAGGIALGIHDFLKTQFIP